MNNKILLPEHYPLQNGSNIFAFFINNTSITKIDLIFYNCYNDGNTFLINKCLKDLILLGFKNHSSTDIYRLINYYGINTYIENYKEYIIITFYFIDRYINNVLYIMNILLSSASFLQNDLNKYKYQSIYNLYNKALYPEYLSKLNRKKIFFGKKTFYGYTIQLKDMINLSRKDIFTYYDNIINNKNCNIIITSNENNYNLVQKLKLFFEKISYGNNTLIKNLIFDINSAPIDKYHIKNDNIQSILSMGKIININYLHEDYPKLIFVNTILGGYFNSRLMMSLREKMKYTYDITSNLYSFKNFSTILIYCFLNKHYTKKSIAIIYNEINKIINSKICDEELNKVKKYIYSQYINSLDYPFNFSNYFKRFLSIKDYNKYYTNFENTINGIKKEEIQIIAQKYLYGKYYEIII
ncbi:MAG: insulinase family protein [Bacteroides sp.]|nr:MAG: insulinase family protein [Bacteroides sp.]